MNNRQIISDKQLSQEQLRVQNCLDFLSEELAKIYDVPIDEFEIIICVNSTKSSRVDILGNFSNETAAKLVSMLHRFNPEYDDGNVMVAIHEIYEYIKRTNHLSKINILRMLKFLERKYSSIVEEK